jgi:hypothetical protein
VKSIPWDDPYFEIHAAEYVEPPLNPVCPICGAGMAIKRLEPGATIWHCDGIAYWDKWDRGHRAPGRWANDGHSIKSQLARRR